MTDGAVRGNDDLIGGANASNTMYGDAGYMTMDSVGGNDALAGGDDTLISGTGTDYMWGDAVSINSPDVTTGADTFVFDPGSGNDAIFDFRQSDGDAIDVSGYGFTDISSLTISASSFTAPGDFDTADFGSYSNVASTLIDFGGGNTVTLVGFTGTLTAADFKFA